MVANGFVIDDNNMKQSLSLYDDSVTKALQKKELEEEDESIGNGSYYNSGILNIEMEGGEPIRVGNILAMLPESTDGDPKDVKHTAAAYLAVRDFNNRKFIFPHRTEEPHQDTPSWYELTKGCNFYMTLTIRDTGRNFFMAGKEWVDAFYAKHSSRSHHHQRPMAVVGPIASQISATVATLGAVTTSVYDGKENEGIVTISPSSTASFLEDRTRYPYFARTITSNSVGIANSAMHYFHSIGVKQFIILHVETAFGRDVLEEALKAVNAKYSKDMTVYVASYVEGNQISMKHAVSLLQQVGYKYHFGIQPSKEMILELYDGGLLGNQNGDPAVWVFYGAGVSKLLGKPQMDNEDRLGDVHKALDKSIMVATRRISGNQNSDIMKEELERFKNDDHAVQYLLSRHAGGGVFEKDPESYHSLLNQTSFLSSVRLYTYDAVVSLGIAACQTKNFSTPRFYETLKKLTFMGGSGRVVYDEMTGTRLDDDTRFSFYNMFLSHQQDGSNSTILSRGNESFYYQLALTVGNNGSEYILTRDETTPIVYSDGSIIPPSSIPPVFEEMNLVSFGLRCFCCILAGLVIVASIYCALWTMRNRKHDKVKASQPIFLVLLCIGTFFMGCSIIPLTFQEPMPQTMLDIGCMLNVWLLSIGFSTTFAALFTKTYRIRKVMNSAVRFRRIRVAVSDVVWIPTSLFSLNILILTVWSILDPLKWNRVVLDVDVFDRPTVTMGTCYKFNHNNDNLNVHDDDSAGYDNNKEYADTISFAFLIILNCSAFLLASIQSFQARNLPSYFNESLYITITDCIIVEAFLLGIPLVTVLNSNSPSSFMGVASWIIAISAFAVLFFLFFPKIRDTNISEPQSSSPSTRFSTRWSGSRFSSNNRLRLSGRHHLSSSRAD